MTSKTYMPKPSLEAFAKPVFFYTTVPSSEVTYASPSVENVLGYHPKDIVGRKCHEFLDQDHPLNSTSEKRKHDRFSTTRTMSTIRVVRDAQRGKRLIEQQSYGEADITGNVFAVHVMALDITDRFKMGSAICDRITALQASSDKLSQRERDVLKRVMDGRLNKSIARELQCSERTVEMARSRLMEKFNAETSAQLIRLATEHSILSQLISNEAVVGECTV